VSLGSFDNVFVVARTAVHGIGVSGTDDQVGQAVAIDVAGNGKAALVRRSLV
jgi:hypothetical protein